MTKPYTHADAQAAADRYRKAVVVTADDELLALDEYQPPAVRDGRTFAELRYVAWPAGWTYSGMSPALRARLRHWREARAELFL